MPSSESTAGGLTAVMSDAIHELVMTGALVLRETARNGALAVGEAGKLSLFLPAQLGRVIELRMTRLLNALQIPTSRDLRELSDRVDALSRQLETSGRLRS